MKLRNVARQKALPMALAFLLAVCFAMIIPGMRAEADYWRPVFTDDSDLDQKVDQAKVIEDGTYNKTDGELISAKYPSELIYDQEKDMDKVLVTSGEGYFFRLDLPANTVALVGTENQEDEGGRGYTILGYQFNPTDSEGMQYDYSKMKNTLGITRNAYGENEFVFANPNETGVTKCFLFVPKDSVLNKFRITYQTIASSDGYCIYLTDAGAPNRLEDKLDSALEVSKGSAVDLSRAETVEVCAATKTYYGDLYYAMNTEKIRGKLLKINGGNKDIHYMTLKNSVDYNAYSAYDPDEDIAKRDFSFDRFDNTIWVGDVSYLFLSEDAEFDQWFEDAPPIDLSAKLDKNKVNVVSWDDAMQWCLKQVYTVHPELKDKVNYINLGIASSAMKATRDEIAEGKYEGYTILAIMDVSEVDSARNFPDLSELGLTASDYSDSYPYLREMGTFDGKLKAVSWQACPNGFVYNASIARKVLGTDDPEQIQEMISTPAKFNDVAKKMKAAGYFMTTGTVLSDSTKEYYKNYPQKKDFYAQLIELGKTYDAASYDTGNEMWMDGWSDDMMSGKVFGLFSTIWMRGVFIGNGVENGIYKLCEGPISYFWGGTFLAAKDLGTQKQAALEVIKGLTCDPASMEKIETGNGDFVNNQTANLAIAAKGAMADPFYAGSQDPTLCWHRAALGIGGQPAAPVSVAKAQVVLSADTFTYNGKVQKPSVKSVTVDGKKLVSGTDYTVTWQNANPKNAGTYTVTINGKGAYKDSKKLTFKINAKKITPTVSLSKKSFTFNGKAQKPKVTVKDGTTSLAASNYTVKFAAGCKNVGTYKITVTLKGNYSGTKTVSYSITKKANPLKVKAKKAAVSFAKLKKANQSFAITKAVTFTKKGQGTMVYAKKSGNAKIKINKTGRITVAKGLKKGTYTVKITVKAKGNANYKASKAIPLAIKIVVK